MATEAHMTMSGNLTSAPRSGSSTTGATWARLRVASTPRVFDRSESTWRDGETVFLDVVCWRRLADNVVASLQRGDRVLVSGRVRQRSYQDSQGTRHTVTELEADAVGPDLVRHPARLQRPAVVETADPVTEPDAAPVAVTEPPAEDEPLIPDPKAAAAAL